MSAFPAAKVTLSKKGKVVKEFEALHGVMDLGSNKITITMMQKNKIDKVIDLNSFQETDYANPW